MLAISIVLFVVPDNSYLVIFQCYFTYRISLFRNQNLNIFKKSQNMLYIKHFQHLFFIQTRLWKFLNIRKVPVFGRYLQVQMPKKATFRIQIKRFFHICFHKGIIPLPFHHKINYLFHSLLFTYQSNVGYVERIFYYDGIHVC